LSSIRGGVKDLTLGVHSWASGGYSNTAEGNESSVSGGAGNNASGTSSSISGGGLNKAIGTQSWIGGGEQNKAEWATVSGGFGELVTSAGKWGSVFGEKGKTAKNNYEAIL
jgi:hypothetical protein